MDVGTQIKVSAFAILKLVFIAFIGFVGARWCGFNSIVRAGWSKMIFTFFLPATVFYQTATAINELSELKELWICPVACAIHIVFQFLGCILVGKILRIPTLENRVFSFTLGFANIFYIPMAITESFIGESDILGEGAKEKAFSYICTYQLSYMVGFFIIGYNYINLNVRDLKKKEEELNNEIGVEMENEGVNEIHPENISFEEKRGSRESVEQIEENNKSELKEDIHIDIEKIKDITKTIDKKEEVPNPLLEYQVKPIHYEEEDEGIDDDDILVDDEISSDELEEEQENETTTQNVSQNGSIKMDEVRDKTPSIPSRDISVNSPEIIKSKEDVTSQEKATKTRKINSF
ncbi:hypothetical protein EIN_496980, partial [Entamoeba invadens IP1]